MKVEDYVGRLLYRFDCVIVPGWGGLVSSYRPATIHPVTHIMNPPAKALTFNPLLNKNDGLLVNEIAAGESVSYDEAVTLVDRYVQEMRSELELHHAVDWEHIGIFQLGPENKIVFKAHNEINYLADSFGLSVLRSPAIQREERKIVTLDKEDSVLAAATSNTSRRGWWRAAAVLVPLVGIAALSYWQREAVTQGVYAGILNFTATGPELYEPRTEEETLVPIEKAEVENWWDIAHENARPKPEAPSPIEHSTATTDNTVNTSATYTTASTSYHVIAGCFSNESNADKLLAKLQAEGLPARRIGTTDKGLHIVTYESFGSRREALEGLSRIKREHSADAWLLKK